jgi:hypothetical protein
MEFIKKIKKEGLGMIYKRESKEVMKKKEEFIKVLEFLIQGDIMLDEWEFVKIKDGRAMVLSSKKKDKVVENNDESFDDFISQGIQCICSKHIETSHFIKNIRTNQIFLVGVTCIKKFNEGLYVNIKQKKCLRCGEMIKRRDRSRPSSCKDCAGLFVNQNTLVDFGKYIGETHYKMYNDKSYCDWIIRQDNFRHIKTRNWIMNKRNSDCNDNTIIGELKHT